MFAAAGWQVITVKFGTLLESLFTRPGGQALRTRILDMPNPEYQRLLRCERRAGAGPAARGRPRRRRDRGADRRTRRRHPDRARSATSAATTSTPCAPRTRRSTTPGPTVIIAYTIKGYGLPTQGHPQNHSSLLTVEQYEQLAAELGMDPANPWARFDADSAAGRRVRSDRGPAAARPRRTGDPARGPDRHRPHPVGHLHHPGRPRAGRCWT